MIVENVERVEFLPRRWQTDIRVVLRDGTEQVYVASADSGYTYGDGIWFGTSAEHAEAGELI